MSRFVVVVVVVVGVGIVVVVGVDVVALVCGSAPVVLKVSKRLLQDALCAHPDPF